MTKVIHIRDATGSPDEVYIGRPKAGQPWNWGNPFAVGKNGDRDEVIAKFAKWFINGIDPRTVWMREHIHELKGKTLVCFCAPAKCHGHVLAKFADFEATKDEAFWRACHIRYLSVPRYERANVNK